MSFDFLQCIHHHPSRRGKNAKQTSVRKFFQSLDKYIHPKSPLKLCYLFILCWDNNSELSRHKITSAIRLSLDTADIKCIDTQRTYRPFPFVLRICFIIPYAPYYDGLVPCTRDIKGISELPLIQLIL